jgi:hypothetical protein
MLILAILVYRQIRNSTASHFGNTLPYVAKVDSALDDLLPTKR